MSYAISLITTELIKIKNSFVIWITIVGSLVLPILLFLAFAIDTQEFVARPSVDTWADFLNRACNGCCFFSQITATLIIGLIVNIEHEANGWKHILVLPQSRASLFFNKLLVVWIAVIAFLALYFSLTLISGKLLSAYRPELLFSRSKPDLTGLTNFILKFMISLLGIVAIQFWLSIRSRNLFTSLTIGILGVCLGMLLKKWKYIALFPYASPFLMLNYPPTHRFFLETYHWTSMITFLAVIIFAYRDFKQNFNGH